MGNNECVVFSIGSDNQWEFEEAIYARTPCRIETFDCTVKDNAKVPETIQDRTRLHRVCLGDKEEFINDKQFSTWNSLLQIAEMSSAPTFLKMDIEGFEYPVMRAIIESGKNMPLQIAMELHYSTYEHIFHGCKSSAEIYAFMNYLQVFGGYYLIDRRDNYHCPHCSEIVLAKLDCKHVPMTFAFDALRNQTDATFANSLTKIL